MAILIHPKRWVSQQPAGAQQINFGHPLAKGLTAYILFNAGGGQQRAIFPNGLIGNAAGTPPSPLWVTKYGARSQNYDGNWNQWYERGTWFEPNWITVLGRFRKGGTVVQDASFLRKAFNDGGSAPFASYGTSFNASNSGQGVMGFFFADQTNTLRGPANFTPTANLNLVHDYGYTIGPSGGNGVGIYYIDAVQQNSTNVTGMTGIGYDKSTGGRFFPVGNTVAGSRAAIIGEGHFVAVWNRPLSAMEMEWIHVEPYALLMAQRQTKRMYVGFGGSGTKDGGYTTFFKNRTSKQQPPVGPRINFSHPLAKGLTFLAVMNAGAGLQQALLPSGLPGHSVGTLPKTYWTPGGPGGLGQGHFFDGNWGMWYERGLWNEPPTNLTVVCRKRRIGSIANQDTPATFKTFGNTGVSPFLSYRLNNNPSASAGQDNVSFDVATGGTFHLGSVYSAGSGQTLLEHTHGGTYTSGSLRVWYNGIPRTNDNVTGTLSYDQTTTGRLLLATNSALSSTVPYPGVFYWTGIWNRVLTPSEMEWLHLEPYAMLVPSVRRKYFIPLAPPSNVAQNAPAIHTKRWTYKQPPAGNSKIDFGHPLAKGLTFHITYNAGAGMQKALQPPNLPGNSVGSVKVPNWISSQGGLSQNFDGNWGQWYERGLWVEPANAVTLLVRLRRTGSNPQYAVPAIKTYNNAGSTPFWSYGLEYNRAGAGQDVVVALAPNANVGTTVSLATGATLNEHTLAMSYLPSTGALKLYFNGQLKQTDSVAGTPALTYDASSTGRFIVSGASAAAAGNEFVGEIYSITVWNRVLTDAEQRWMANEPYAFIVPAHKRRMTSAAVVTVTANTQPNICVAIF